jgi:hypothetical protein
MSWWDKVWHAKEKHWIKEWPKCDVPSKEIAPNSGYVSVMLERMQIPNARKWLSTYHGTINSHIALQHDSPTKAEYHKVTPDEYLRKLSPNKAGRIIVGTQRLAGAVPYRGGDIETKIALIAVKNNDLAAPYLKLLGEISEKAGVTYITAALPYVGFLKRGMELLTDTADDSALEVGLDQVFNSPKTGVFCVVAAEREKYPDGSLACKADFSVVDSNQNEVEEAYFTFTFNVDAVRADWHQIPELEQHYAKVREAVIGGKVDLAKELMATFKRVALWSPDLLEEHAHKIIAEVEAKLKQALLGGTTGFMPKRFPELKDLKPFGK